MTDATEWTCGHVAGAMCAECYHLLAFNAGAIARERDDLRERIGGTAAFLDGIAKSLDAPLRATLRDNQAAAERCRAMAARLRGDVSPPIDPDGSPDEPMPGRRR